MAKASTLLSFVLCIGAVLATPAKVPISRKKLTTTNTKDFLQREQVRVTSFGAAAKSKDSADANVASAPAINGDVSYSTLTVVNGGTFNLIVDTGSSNTWVGANNPFNATGANSTGGLSQIIYGSGTFYGIEYIAPVSLAGLNVPQQDVGVAEIYEGWGTYDGVIGFGPVDLTEGTVDGLDTVPTFMDSLFADGTIATEVLGISFAPESGSDEDDQNGELTLGGIDNSKFSGTPTYVPKSTVSPYSLYWGVDTSTISYGSTEIFGGASAVVDTGTTLIWIPTEALDAFLSASGGSIDSNSGLPSWSTEPTEDFTISIDGHALPLTPTQYLVPEAQYGDFGLDSGKFYAWFTDGGSDAADLNFIIGQKFLEHYYSIYDTTNSRLGFAPSVLG